jgi:(5-formylfuran-3-yl)methyl phosphate synthase
MNAAKRASPRFLASVRSRREALVALAGGADIIDVKEPLAGALGAAPLPVISEIVEAIGGASPVSATIGDCPVAEAAPYVLATAGAGVDYVKIGLFGEVTAAALGRFERCASVGIRLIAVMFADRAPRWDMIGELAGAGFSGVMLDTAAKGHGGLLCHLALSDVAAFVAKAHGAGLLAGLAGSLGPQDAPLLMPLGPDVLGFRGALCGGGERAEMLDRSRVSMMRAIISQSLQPERAAGRASVAEDMM